jgi:membrane protein involved in colicin uptake
VHPVKKRRTAIPLGLVASVAVHVALIAAAVLVTKHAPAGEKPGLDFYVVDIVPAEGVMQGDVASTGAAPAAPARTRMTTASRSPSHRDAAEPRALPEAPDGDQPRRSRKEEAKEAAKKVQEEADAEKQKERDAMREAVRKTMLAPPDAQAGQGTDAKPPVGTADGKPGGSGTAGRTGVSSKYAGVLDGWFSSRVNLRGLDIPWEELKGYSVVASIQLSPDRHVTSFQIVRPSGNAAYDARVQSSLASIVSSGAMLPAPPEDEEVPPQINLRFRCRSQERCS